MLLANIDSGNAGDILLVIEEKIKQFMEENIKETTTLDLLSRLINKYL
jgi:phage-related protein